MARGIGRKATLSLAILASSMLAASAHAQTSRGLLASPDSLSAPLLAQQSDPTPSDDEDPPSDPSAPSTPNTPPPSTGTEPTGSNSGPGQGGATLSIGGSAGTSAAPSTTPQADQPPAEKKKPSMTIYDRLAGSSFYTLTGTSIGTLFKGYQPDYNPTVYTYGLLAPRFAITKAWQLRARGGFNIEYTDADTTKYRNEFELLDTTVQLFYRGIPAIGGMLKLTPFAQVTLPTSKASRARTMIFTPGIGLQAAVGIEHFLGGEAIALAMFTYTRPIYKYQTPGVEEQPYQPACFGGNDCGGQAMGMRNARDTYSTSVIFAPSWGKIAPGAWFLLANQVAYKGSAAAQSTLPNGQEPSNSRVSTFFALWLDYELNDWLTPEIGYQQQRNLRSDDGGYGNPIFSKYQQQTLYIGANVQLDSLLKKIAGEEGQGGVVRAKAAPNPIRFY